MRSLIAALVAVALGGAGAQPGRAAPADPPPVSTRLDLAGLPANTWVEISQAQKPEAAFCSAWYLPASDEFLLWGKLGGHREESKRYEAQVLKLGDQAPEWQEAFPPGKEAAWANGRFPNWGCGCHRLGYQPERPWLESAADRWIGGSAEINRVTFVETDGVVRPTRAYTHHQAAYDSKRGRLVYYVGGKTFAYDPQKRSWADLQAQPPLACEALAWASMAYDPVGDQIVLFGGAYALNPWGGARTWLFDCAKNEWRRAPVRGGIEPPLRCCTQLAYDSRNRRMVLFGGDALDRFLADTWVLDPATLTWAERKPEKSPPPLDHAAACFIERHGLVLLVSPPKRGDKRSADAWAYDTARNVWTPLALRLPDKPMEWVSCAYSARHEAAVLVAPGVGTWVCRLDPATASDPKAEAEMAPPGSWTWNTRAIGQTRSILDAPPPDRAATAKRLQELP
ncbi:MAG TPA: kelch repeat-containing protein, partial [Planctomycetota bacterium]|nr:kelch repeat-containing protein [Planctomycetota bacterium]